MSRDWALVTGASHGIGYEICRVLARRGHPLIMVARSEDILKRASSSIRHEHAVETVPIVADLSDVESIRTLWNRAVEVGEIDVLVNNAGYGMAGPFHAASPEETIRMAMTHVLATTCLTRLALPSMLKRRRGWILNVASTAAFQPLPGMAAYAAAKAYVLHLSEALSREVRGTGVTVTCIAPGPVRTDFFRTAGMRTPRGAMDPARVAEIAVRAMMRGKRVVVPGPWNAAVAYLARIMPRGIVLRVGEMITKRWLRRPRASTRRDGR